ncbi:hypothetical protein DFA_07059 [Cavenderia fasciculata]|uniref:Pentacotripeptide-repeat region of PRORP domain-containing protein n=1 Tax=Cavenderia fasciculata TaxID=261658 RepID=F4PVD6_CACFS|nr:uncharacterized protein DFA_07059 [Cavenderia fasciculata]EGG19950.1 hypothetical protein DFA_07059 [Cavenderia fasciculata]|eukprot:XP_004366933.1 hypothetical protein DFA_07059 [Cavenderia fasciculata]
MNNLIRYSSSLLNRVGSISTTTTTTTTTTTLTKLFQSSNSIINTTRYYCSIVIEERISKKVKPSRQQQQQQIDKYKRQKNDYSEPIKQKQVESFENYISSTVKGEEDINSIDDENLIDSTIEPSPFEIRDTQHIYYKQSPLLYLEKSALHDYFSQQLMVDGVFDRSRLEASLVLQGSDYNHPTILFGLFGWLENLKINDIELFSMLLEYMKQYKKHSRFLTIYKYMRANMEDKFTINTYNMALGVCVDIGEFGLARLVVKDIIAKKEQGVFMNSATMVERLKLAVAMGGALYLEELIKKVMDPVRSTWLTDRSDQLNAQVLESILNHGKRDVERTLTMYKEMRTRGYEIGQHVYHTLLIGFASLARYDLMDQIWKDLDQSNTIPLAKTVAALVVILNRKDMQQVETSLFNHVKNSNYNFLLDTPEVISARTKLFCARRTDGQEIVSLLNNLKQRGKMTVELLHIILAHILKSKAPWSKKIIDDIYTLVVEISSVKYHSRPPLKLYEMLLSTAITRKYGTEVTRWIREMNSFGIEYSPAIISYLMRYYLVVISKEIEKEKVEKNNNNNLLAKVELEKLILQIGPLKDRDFDKLAASLVFHLQNNSIEKIEQFEKRIEQINSANCFYAQQILNHVIYYCLLCKMEEPALRYFEMAETLARQARTTVSDRVYYQFIAYYRHQAREDKYIKWMDKFKQTRYTYNPIHMAREYEYLIITNIGTVLNKSELSEQSIQDSKYKRK